MDTEKVSKLEEKQLDNVKGGIILDALLCLGGVGVGIAALVKLFTHDKDEKLTQG